MSSVLYIPLALQGFAMLLDEGVYHRRRRLGLWETLGHPLDTLTVFLAYWFLVSHEFTAQNLWIYAGLSFFSCLFVTKDEFVHSKVCCAQENWLHAFLFVMHPICFLAAGFLWYEGGASSFLQIQAIVIFCFMFYQITYWGFAWKKRQN